MRPSYCCIRNSTLAHLLSMGAYKMIPLPPTPSISGTAVLYIHASIYREKDKVRDNNHILNLMTMLSFLPVMTPYACRAMAGSHSWSSIPRTNHPGVQEGFCKLQVRYGVTYQADWPITRVSADNGNRYTTLLYLLQTPPNLPVILLLLP